MGPNCLIQIAALYWLANLLVGGIAKLDIALPERMMHCSHHLAHKCGIWKKHRGFWKIHGDIKCTCQK